MNVLKKGEEMLRGTVFLSRFMSPWKQRIPHSQIKPAIRNRRDNCIGQCLHYTLQGHALNNVRHFCQGETQAPSFGEHVDNHPSFQAPTFIAGGKRDALLKAEASVPFRTKLQDCLSPCDVLDLAERCTPAQGNVSNSMMRMWEMTKKMSSEQKRFELKLMSEHPAFECLCHGARMHAPHMATVDLAYTLLAAVKLGVSQRSLVVQTLLRVVQERLNQFDEKSLSIVATCLEDMDSNKNTDALKQGLKLLLEDRIPAIQNVMLLQTLMRLLGKDTPPALKRKLEAKALSMVDEFTLPNAQYMLTTLATLNLNSKPLLDICSRMIADSIHTIPFTRLLAGLKSCRELNYRNFSLFSSISDYLADTLTMWSNKQVIFFLLEFEGLGFYPVALLDAFAERVVQKPDRLTLRDLLSILKVYSSLNHDLKGSRQEFLANVTRVLKSYLPRMGSADLLKAASCLSVLGHFPNAPLEELLQEHRLEELLNTGGRSSAVEWKLHGLGLCLRLEGPALPRTLAPLPDLGSVLSPHQRPVNPGLVSALKSLVGESAVQDSVVVERVYFIDCVITLAPEAEDVCRLSEHCSKTLENPKRIAVLCAPPSSFCFGSTHPRSGLAVKTRHLKILGYEPVLVPIHELENHTNQERVKVLKTLIFPHEESSSTDQLKVD